MRHVKITDSKGQTKNNTQWGKNITHEAKGEGTELCTDGVLHGYYDEYVAVFMNPIHGNYNEDTMQLWESEGEPVADDGVKMGFKKQTTVKQIEKPVLTINQRTVVSIKLALLNYKAEPFVKWAEGWLSGKDRTANAAYAAYAEAYAANAANAAYAAAYAAYSAAAAYAANAANAAYAAYAEAYAAKAAAYAAYAAYSAAEAYAAYAAAYAAYAAQLSQIIKEVINERD